MYKDTKMANSFYAAVPVMKTDVVPSYETSSKDYGIRYDALLAGTASLDTTAADTIVALQNEECTGVVSRQFTVSCEYCQ